MNKSDVIAFFDHCADSWDAEMIRSDAIIGRILDNGGVCEGVDVLDVACGTGVLFPDYLARKVNSVTAVDISPEMVKIAESKYPEAPITVLCADVETAEFDRQFDVVMVYNAFPHFPEPEKLLHALAACLKPGGRVSIAHGMSRAMIDRHHQGSASKISNGLMCEDTLAQLMSQEFQVDIVISDDKMYQVSGRKK